VKAAVGDLVFYRPHSRARENVPVLPVEAVQVGAEGVNQTGVTRVFPGDVLEVVTTLRGGWVLARYPRLEGVLLVHEDYCEVWKRADVRAEEI
jgi:hypothetical protein